MPIFSAILYLSRIARLTETEMYCSQCATPLGDTDVYCPNCSKPVASFRISDNVSQVEPSETQTVVRPRTAVTKATWPAAAVGALAGSVVTLAVVGLFILAYLQMDRSKQDQANSASNGNSVRTTPVGSETVETPTPAPTPEPKPKVLIVNEQFPVPAGEQVTYPFHVTTEARVTGGFVTYGGSNDIDASLIDQRGGVYYHSGYTTKGKINIQLPPGTYTLVFSNRRAWFTDKSVAAEVYYQEQ